MARLSSYDAIPSSEKFAGHHSLGRFDELNAFANQQHLKSGIIILYQLVETGYAVQVREGQNLEGNSHYLMKT